MENTKKMILVEPSVIERLKQKENAPEDSLSRLDTEMQDIMKSKTEDREKWMLYLQTLQRYLHFSGEERKPIKLPLITETAPTNNETNENNSDSVSSPSNEHVLSKKYSGAQILGYIPKTYKIRAGLLIKTLQENTNKIYWDDHGTVYIENKPILGSNVLDLINDVLRPLKRGKPSGWESFAKALKDINVPLGSIGNPTTVEFIKRLHLQESQEGAGYVKTKKSSKSLTNSGNSKKQPKINWEKWTPY